MLNYLWPIGLVILSNTAYQICAKSVPGDMDPFASLTVSYLVGAVISAVLFFALNRSPGLLRELEKTNWAPLALGIVIIGLEVGYIFAYKAGWEVSTASIVQSSVLAVALIFLGKILYREPLSWNKLLGVAICLVGLGVINYK